MDAPFYADGLRWSCVNCSYCCRYESGYIFLSKNDLAALARELSLPENLFIQMYCRWVPVSMSNEFLSLKETSNNDCFLWEDGCSVYDARPSQCRTYPFWKNHLESREIWDESISCCPGAEMGTLHSQEDIEACIALEERELPLARKRLTLHYPSD